MSYIVYSADAQTLAVHFDAGGDAPSAGRYYKEAGQTAMKALAFRHAAELLEKALEKLQPPPGERGELLESLADARANAGLNSLAAQAYLEAHRFPGLEQRADLTRKAAYQYCIGGYVNEGLATFGEVLQNHNLSIPGSRVHALVKRLAIGGWLAIRGFGYTLRQEREVAPVQLERLDAARLAGASLGAIDPVRASYFSALGLKEALRVGEPERLLRALSFEAIVWASFNAYGRKMGYKCLAAAEPLLERCAQPAATAFLRLAQGAVAFTSYRLAEASGLLAESDQLFAGCTGVQWEQSMVHIYQAWVRVSSGATGEMAATLPALYHDARELGDRFTAVNLGQWPYVLTALAQDRPDLAERLVNECEASRRPDDYQLQDGMGSMGRSWLHIYRGEAEAAWRCASGHWDLAVASQIARLENLAIYMGHARGLAAVCMARRCAPGGTDRARFLDEARTDAKRLSKRTLAHGPAMGLELLASVASLEGNRAEAEALLEQTSRRFEQRAMYLHANVSKRRLGQLRGGTEGALLIHEAEEWMTQQGIANFETMSSVLVCRATAN